MESKLRPCGPMELKNRLQRLRKVTTEVGSGERGAQPQRLCWLGWATKAGAIGCGMGLSGMHEATGLGSRRSLSSFHDGNGFEKHARRHAEILRWLKARDAGAMLSLVHLYTGEVVAADGKADLRAKRPETDFIMHLWWLKVRAALARSEADPTWLSLQHKFLRNSQQPEYSRRSLPAIHGQTSTSDDINEEVAHVTSMRPKWDRLFFFKLELGSCRWRWRSPNDANQVLFIGNGRSCTVFARLQRPTTISSISA